MLSYKKNIKTKYFYMKYLSSQYIDLKQHTKVIKNSFTQTQILIF